MGVPHRHWIRARKRKQSIAGLVRRRIGDAWAWKGFPFVLFGAIAAVIVGAVVWQVGWLLYWW